MEPVASPQVTVIQVQPLQSMLQGRYRFERELGRGGMAQVWLAQDLRHDRPVALKVLRPDIAAAVGAERFLREIRLTARLQHPNILPVLDSGAAAGERGSHLLWYTMPLVEGETLRSRLARERQLPVPDALGIVREVADALDCAHRRGIVHRDVKPENILLGGGHALLADFGIAKMVAGDPSDPGEVTSTGLALGTPAYMSPEQAVGDPAVDARTDVYALGCVLYEMLAGEPPFAGSGARATMARHAVEPPVPVRTRRPTVPVAVERALDRALAKAPGERFPTMTDFVAALVDPAGDVASAAAYPGRDARAIAVLPFVNASADPENEYFSDGITEELITALTKVEGLHVASRTSVFALKGLREDVRTLGARLNVSAVLEGSVRRAGQRLRITAQLTGVRDGRTLWSERYDRELADVFAIQDEIARTIVDTLRATLLQDLGDPTPVRYRANLKAYQLYLKGRYSWNRRTQAAIAEGIEYFEAAIAEDADYALAYTGLADSYALQIDYRGAPVQEGLERARVEAQRALALDETLAEAHTSLAWVTFIYDWDWPLAARHFRRAIELNPRYSVARQWHSWFQMAMGQTELALAEGRQALALDPAARAGARAAPPRAGDEPDRRGEPPAARPGVRAGGAVGRGRGRVPGGARGL
jgi:eukaryotic-like serine/threonine-protein kinase